MGERYRAPPVVREGVQKRARKIHPAELDGVAEDLLRLREERVGDLELTRETRCRGQSVERECQISGSAGFAEQLDPCRQRRVDRGVVPDPEGEISLRRQRPSADTGGKVARVGEGLLQTPPGVLEMSKREVEPCSDVLSRSIVSARSGRSAAQSATARRFPCSCSSRPIHGVARVPPRMFGSAVSTTSMKNAACLERMTSTSPASSNFSRARTVGLSPGVGTAPLRTTPSL